MMKKKAFSFVLILALICGMLFAAPVSANENDRTVSDPSGLIYSAEVMNKINAYIAENPVLADSQSNGNGIIFLFEGAGEGGPYSYTLGSYDTRNQALAVIVKNYEVTYANYSCSTIASGNPKERTRNLGWRGVAGVATILDGIYKLRLCIHGGYEAFNLTLNGTDVLPCVRWVGDSFRVCPVDDPANLWADSINMHTRNSANSMASDGCQVIGNIYNFEEFMWYAKASTNAETNAGTYCVVDRTMAYGLDVVFPGCVDMLLNGNTYEYVAPAESSLRASLDKVGSVEKGKAYNISGFVSSNYPIVSATGSFISNGNAVQSVTVNPNAYYLDIYSSDINMRLGFGKLAPGSYTLKLSATDSSGETVETEQPFEIIGNAASTLTISPSPISKLYKGDNYLLTGTVESNYKLSNVQVKVLSGYTTKISSSVWTSAYSVDLGSSQIKNMNYTYLPVGNYVLQITATDSSGKKVVSEQPFVIENMPSTLAVSLPDSLGEIIVGNAFTLTGSVSSNYNLKTVQAQVFSGNTQKMTATIWTSNKTCDLASGNIKNMNYKTLPEGSYTVRVTAADQSGLTKVEERTLLVVNPKQENVPDIDVSGYPEVKYGSTGEYARLVQKKLNEKIGAGLSVDGIFGNGTKNAVIRFQNSVGLTADGVVGANTWKFLLYEEGSPAAPPEEPQGTDIDFSSYPVVQKGTTGQYAKLVQQKLNEKMGLHLDTDGIFGSNTKSAVIDFQKSVGITADGVVREDTWKYLLTDAAEQKQDSPEEQSSSQIDVSGYPYVSYGTTGEYAKLAQQKLNEKIDARLDVDGIFGKLSKYAAIDFQNSVGLPADGIIGPATWAELLK